MSLAVFAVFLTLEATELLLVIANFSNNTGTLLHIGGYVGIATAAAAWYASAAGVINGMRGHPVLFVGGPIVPAAHEITVGDRV